MSRFKADDIQIYIAVKPRQDRRYWCGCHAHWTMCRGDQDV